MSWFGARLSIGEVNLWILTVDSPGVFGDLHTNQRV